MTSAAGFLAAHEAGVPVALPTSGTAGPPRWVVRTTGSWVSSFPAVSALTGLGAGCRVWVPGPTTATMNLFAAAHALSESAALVDDVRGATHAHLTPSLLARALDGDLPLDGVDVVVAGDRLSPALHERAVAAGARVHHYYGAAELSFVAWGTHAEDLRAFPGVLLAVRAGEVWVRSPFVCTGYDGTPGPLRTDADGWATVGDVGELDGDRLAVGGRPGSVGVGGATVATAAVERVLREPARGEVHVVGVPHADLGQVLTAVLTDPDDLRQVRAAARTHLVGAARPRLWLHVAALPVTPAGKVDRGALQALASDGDGRARRLV